jgi:NAD(P)-dependent dehydrogenase (short-subunit alcohol dehydrogenase family)
MVDAPKSFYGLEIDGFNSVFNLNFIGTLLPTQILSQDMSHKKSSVVINISSMAAFHPLSKIPAYSAAKAAVSNISEWLAVCGTHGHSGQRHGARVLFNRAIKVFSLRRSRQLNNTLRACY